MYPLELAVALIFRKLKLGVSAAVVLLCLPCVRSTRERMDWILDLSCWTYYALVSPGPPPRNSKKRDSWLELLVSIVQLSWATSCCYDFLENHSVLLRLTRHETRNIIYTVVASVLPPAKRSSLQSFV